MELVPYDDRWPEMYRLEERRLRRWIPDAGRIEHFGSTAVPGMVAKPVIDILLEVEDPASPLVKTAMEEAGYQGWWRTDREPEYLFCVRLNGAGRRTHHVHVHDRESVFWERLWFRDLLRLDPGEREDYEKVKREAAASHPDDREAYTQAKSEYVAAATKRARRRLTQG